MLRAVAKAKRTSRTNFALGMPHWYTVSRAAYFSRRQVQPRPNVDTMHSSDVAFSAPIQSSWLPPTAMVYVERLMRLRPARVLQIHELLIASSRVFFGVASQLDRMPFLPNIPASLSLRNQWKWAPYPPVTASLGLSTGHGWACVAQAAFGLASASDCSDLYRSCHTASSSGRSNGSGPCPQGRTSNRPSACWSTCGASRLQGRKFPPSPLKGPRTKCTSSVAVARPARQRQLGSRARHNFYQVCGFRDTLCLPILPRLRGELAPIAATIPKRVGPADVHRHH